MIRTCCFSLILCCSLAANAAEGVPPFNQARATYVIKNEIDLCGQTINLPEGSTLRFRRKGRIKNGTIIGNHSRLSAKKKYSGIFQDITIEGSWSVPKVYSNWMSYDGLVNHTRPIKNLFALCSGDRINDVYVTPGDYYLDGFDVEHNSPSIIRIPSGTRIHNQASFHILATSSVQSFPFYFEDVSDCLWEGGAIIGDLNTHVGDKGEQGFGLALRGASNITIRDVVCRECWGDGINLQYSGGGKHNRNVLIERVVCDGNRRQGVSIEDGIGITVRDSRFVNTGRYRGTAPKYGIDIEPCYEGASFSNIVIHDCVFENNAGGGVSCSYLKPTDSSVSVLNCVDNDGGLRLNGCSIAGTSAGVVVKNYQCPNGKLKFKREVRNVLLEDCSFKSALNETDKKDILSDVTFRRVTLCTSEQRTWNFYCLSLVCAEMTNVLFDSCRFEVLDGSTLSAVLPSGGDWSGVTMDGCTIIEHRENPFYVPCDIKNSMLIANSPISFTNHKKNGSLLFDNNMVSVERPISSSPFLFLTAPNQNYQVQNNTFHYSGAIKEHELIVRHRTNASVPTVRLQGNTFRLLKD